MRIRIVNSLFNWFFKKKKTIVGVSRFLRDLLIVTNLPSHVSLQWLDYFLKCGMCVLLRRKVLLGVLR
jgi:hypothetical protein